MKRNQLLLNYNLQMFAKDGPGGEKTEPATAKRLKEARDEGKVAKSKELTAAADLLVLFITLRAFMSYISGKFFESFSLFYNKIPDIVNECTLGSPIKTVTVVFNEVLVDMLQIMAPFLALGFAITIILGVLQVGFKATLKPLKPEAKKINPASGFKRIFSKDSVFELVKSIVKVSLIAYVSYSTILQNKKEIFVLYDLKLLQSIILCGTIIIDVGLKVSALYIFVGLADFVYQKYRYSEDMKMTKQEVKDEYKNTEGDPQIKGKQRQRMREASQRRMMQDVPKADVIITNPTHLAVALKYNPDSNQAPIVIAKGENYLARKIKEKAKEYKIEIIENKPLARMLYANVDIGAEIPPELYQAVAEVLAMVYNLKNKA